MNALWQWVGQQVIDPLAAGGPMLLAGTTGILALGVLCVAVVRSPAHRQRLGELTLVATLLWLVAVSMPMPRLIDWTPGGSSAPARAEAATGEHAHQFGEQSASDSIDMNPSEEIAVDAGGGPTVSGSMPHIDSPPDPASIRIAPAKSIAAAPPLAPQSSIQEKSSSAKSPFRAAVATALLAGSLAAAVWLAVGQCALWWTCRGSQSADARIQQALSDLPACWRPRRVRVLVAPHCRQPFSVGLLRPRIVLPKSLAQDASNRLLRHVLLHESVHLRRGDGCGHLAANLALLVLWFHPLYWWLRGQVHVARELVADDAASGVSGRAAYVEDLLQLASGRQRSLAAGLGVLGILRFRSLFYRRMTMLIDRKRPLRPARRSWQIGTGILAVALALSLALVAGRPLAADGTNDPDAVEANGAPKKQAEPAAASPRDPNRSERPGTRREGLPNVASPSGLEGGTPGGPFPGSGQGGGGDGSSEGEVTLGVGQVNPAEDIQVPARVAGPIVQVQVRAGDRVTKGQVLAQVDSRDVERKVQAAEAAFAAEMAGSDIAVEYAKKALAVAEVELQRVEKLAESGSVSASEVSRQRLEFQRARLQVETAQAEAAAHKRAVEVKAAEVFALKEQAEDYRVLAPLDGLVVSVSAKPGEWIEAGKPVARIVQLDKVLVNGSVNSRKFDPEQLVGRNVVVDIRRAGDKQESFRGKIEFVSPLVEQGNYMVRVLVENRQTDGQWVLRPGMAAGVRLTEK